MAAVDHFDADDVEVPEAVSCTFTLNGRSWSCKSRDEIDARILDQIAMGRVQVGEFFTGVLVEADVTDFAALTADRQFPMPTGRVVKLMEFLSEQILNRPTVRPSLSQSGPKPTKRTSGAGSSSAGTQRRRSAS